jgi:hypothetical protein
MRLLGMIGTAVLSLTIVAPAYAQQEQHEQEEQKDKPAQQDEKKAQPEKPSKQEEKSSKQEQKPAKPEEKKAQQDRNTKPEEKSAQQDRNTKPEEKSAEHAQQSKPEKQAQRGGGRIPDDRYKANFGREHTFRVSEGDYRNHRFQYGGYWFGFVDPWPSNWLYTQDVYVVEIDGVYYLCNASYPGVNLAISVTV